MMSASPAPAMPTQEDHVAHDEQAENTRPRSSRGVLRWSSVCRATADGELKNPVSITQTIAIAIVGDSAVEHAARCPCRGSRRTPTGRLEPVARTGP